jgi:hypothetical protein
MSPAFSAEEVLLFVLVGSPKFISHTNSDSRLPRPGLKGAQASISEAECRWNDTLAGPAFG